MYIYIYIYMYMYIYIYILGRVGGKSTTSLWRDEHPAVKGPQPPGHHAGHTIYIYREREISSIVLII